jgi:Ca2+/Na+ antiporter
MSSSYYIVILLIGSVTLSKKIKELSISVKTQNKEKIKVDIFFLLLTVALIALLIVLGETSKTK